MYLEGAIAAPIGWKLSDRYGRIRPLAAASTVILVSEIIMIIIAKLPDTFSVDWIYITFSWKGSDLSDRNLIFDRNDVSKVDHSLSS